MSEKEISSSIMAEDGSTDRLVPRRKLTYLRKPQKTRNDGRKDEVKLFFKFRQCIGTTTGSMGRPDSRRRQII